LGLGFSRPKIRPRFCSRDAKKASSPNGRPLCSWPRRTFRSSPRITLISRRHQFGATSGKGATRTSAAARSLGNYREREARLVRSHRNWRRNNQPWHPQNKAWCPRNWPCSPDHRPNGCWQVRAHQQGVKAGAQLFPGAAEPESRLARSGGRRSGRRRRRDRSSRRTNRKSADSFPPNPPEFSLTGGPPMTVSTLRPAIPLATTHIAASWLEARWQPRSWVSLSRKRRYFALKKAVTTPTITGYRPIFIGSRDI